MSLRLTVVTLWLLCSSSGFAQSATPATPAGTSVRVFLDCGFCDFDHLRVETPWVDFVRDRTAADVHLLLTRQQTGSGGDSYSMLVIGLRASSARRDTVVFETPPNSTDDARRNEIGRTIQLALVPYAIRTPAGRGLRVAGPRRSNDEDDRPSGPDPWRAWVFELAFDAEVEAEKEQSDLQYSGELSARRITSALKVGMFADGNFDRSRRTLDDDDDEQGTLTSIRESYAGGIVAVKSVGRKWGVGAELAASSSSFENTSLAVRAAPAVEYSFWPYEEATRRQLVFQYSIGVSTFRYREQTVFDRFRETRPSHAFVVGYDVRQPWGSADAGLEASSYLDKFSQNRLVFSTEWDVRLARGLELEIGGSGSLIHDQLSIPKRDATPEEILQDLRARATDFRYDFRIGFSYTFGSIFNSVVNPRFGTGPGQILR